MAHSTEIVSDTATGPRPTLAYWIGAAYHICMIQLLSALLFSFAAMAQSIPSLEADLKANPGRMTTRTQLAGLYAKQNDLDKAISLLNSYTDQLTPDGFLILASSYSNKKDFNNEVRVLNLLVNKDDENFRWHLLLGQAYLKSAAGETEPKRKSDMTTSAIQQLRRVLQQQPKYKPAYDLLLSTLQQAKANNEARELLQEGLTKFGERPEIYRDMCRLDSSDGFVVQALEHCRKAIKLAPNFPDNYVYLVQSLHDQKEDKLAEADIVSAAKRFPRSEFVQWAAGTLFWRKKNYPVSARYHQAALAADPKSGRAQFGLAQALFESGEEKASLEYFIKACEDDQTTVEVFLAAGGKLKQKGEQKLGELFIQKANSCHK